jgi:NAD(P)-dependent dehydrogenase (short-subunit alcohol dehydrogenase family)
MCANLRGEGAAGKWLVTILWWSRAERRSVRDPESERVTKPVSRTAVVTGGNRGIGLEVCRQLALDVADAASTQAFARGVESDLADYAPAYSLSKAALNAVTRLVAYAGRDRNVLVNAVCPGWVRTGMGGRSAPLSVEQGADTIVWAATLPDGGPSGGFFRDRKPIPW